MARRFTLMLLIFCLMAFLGPGRLRANNAPLDVQDYSQLLNFIAMKDLQFPLVAFGTAEQNFDRRLNRENIAFLNQDKALLRQISSRLKSAELKWKLSSSFKQLMVVPESREDYAHLFEQYCKASVDFLLQRIHMDNPYDQIATFKGTLPALSDEQASKGITVYLVHNIMDAYIEEYLFSTRDDHGSKLKIKLSNRALDGKIGCYTSRLKIGENHHFEFIRESYTLWQNSAKNPLNVFIVPIEETLHILMRPFTEAAMQAELTRSRPTRLENVQHVIDNWMAVEEAIVGGVVARIMPEILARFVPMETVERLKAALAERDAHPQYRFLNRAIQVVADLGIDEALAVYRKDPVDFREMLGPSTSAPAMESAQSPQLTTAVN